LACKINKVDLSNDDSSNVPTLRNFSKDEAIKIIENSAKKIDTTKIDFFIHKGDKGFNEMQAQFAIDFIIRSLNLHPLNKDVFQSSFCVTDSSYLVEYDNIISKPKAKFKSTFYRFYPKSKKILDGITFEEILYK